MPRKKTVITISPRDFRKRMMKILNHDYPKFYDKFVKEIGNEAVRIMKTHTPIRTGAMRNSVKLNSKKTKRGRASLKANFTVGPTMFYSRFVDKGTKASTGRFVPQLGRRISMGTHPGVAARNFTESTARDIIPKIEDFYKRHALRPLKRKWRTIKPKRGGA